MDMIQNSISVAKVAERWIKTHDLVTLRIISFTPPSASNEPVLILSGLAGQIISFREIIRKLSEDTEVFYIETRDKNSSRITGKVQFDIETQGKDVDVIVRELKLLDQEYALLGYSIGATIAVDCYRFLSIKPKFITLLEPNATFDYPKWALYAMRHAPVIGRLPLKIAKWYIGHFMIDREEDNFMYEISANTLDHADIRKLRQTALGIAPYEIWNILESVKCPTLLVGASKDKFHKHSDVVQMIKMMPNCHYEDLETNKRSHSAELVGIIRNFRNNLEAG